MSPARLHRERLAAAAASAAPAQPVTTDGEGGQTTPATFDVPMTPAREHRIASAVASAMPGDALQIVGASGDVVSATIALRLTHDLRRLKEIQSIERKIDAKREMLPHYTAWCSEILLSDKPNVTGIAAEVLPTIMVWSIDVGDWDAALALAEHVIAHQVPLPSRYQRTAPALVVEETAEAAIKLLLAGDGFPLHVLEQVDELTADLDMHDEIRAKLKKAIGLELQRAVDTATGGDAILAAAERALVPLRRAQTLDSRVGVKDRVKKLEKAIKAVESDRIRATAGLPVTTNAAGEAPATEQAGTPPAE